MCKRPYSHELRCSSGHAGPWHVLLISEHIYNMFAQIALACWRVWWTLMRADALTVGLVAIPQVAEVVKLKQKDPNLSYRDAVRASSLTWKGMSDEDKAKWPGFTPSSAPTAGWGTGGVSRGPAVHAGSELMQRSVSESMGGVRQSSVSDGTGSQRPGSRTELLRAEAALEGDGIPGKPGVCTNNDLR